MMSMDEMNAEVLECARYGEHDDLRSLLSAGADVNFADAGGNTALHKAAANGEIQCLKVLKEFGATVMPNAQGNLPLHWAASNKQAKAIKFFFASYEKDLDVLVKNKLGRSILTEAFQSQDQPTIELCLSHPTASEERLMEGIEKGSVRVKIEGERKLQEGENETHSEGSASASASAAVEATAAVIDPGVGEVTKAESREQEEKEPFIEGALTHTMQLDISSLSRGYGYTSTVSANSYSGKANSDTSKSNERRENDGKSEGEKDRSTAEEEGRLFEEAESHRGRIRVRELPITRADKPFGSEVAPEDDTTGLAVWPASIVLARWTLLLQRSAELTPQTQTQTQTYEQNKPQKEPHGGEQREEALRGTHPQSGFGTNTAAAGFFVGSSSSSSSSSSIPVEMGKSSCCSFADLGYVLDMRGKVVVELGAGCGLPGLIAAKCGAARTVYVTDIHEPTLRNAAYNAELNFGRDTKAAACGKTTTAATAATAATKTEASAAQSSLKKKKGRGKNKKSGNEKNEKVRENENEGDKSVDTAFIASSESNSGSSNQNNDNNQNNNCNQNNNGPAQSTEPEEKTKDAQTDTQICTHPPPEECVFRVEIPIPSSHSDTLLNPGSHTDMEKPLPPSEDESFNSPAAPVAAHVAAPVTAAPISPSKSVPVSGERTSLIIKNVNWLDEASYPKQMADVLLGSDLVYDQAILKILVPTIKRLLAPGGSFFYVAPETGRDGMSSFVAALAECGVVLAASPLFAPDEFYENPLEGVEEDFFVLYFYDLAAKTPRHILYRFVHA